MRQRRSLEEGLARFGQRHYRHHNTKNPTSSSSSRSSRSAESFADRRAQSGLPVLVLLSSESYSVNMATLFDGSLLASYGQVLVVTLNYRIGILGEFSISSPCPRFVTLPANCHLPSLLDTHSLLLSLSHTAQALAASSIGNRFRIRLSMFRVSGCDI